MVGFTVRGGPREEKVNGEMHLWGQGWYSCVHDRLRKVEMGG